MTGSIYHDGRAEFWQSHFEQALDYDAYLAASDPRHSARWQRFAAALPPVAIDDAARLRRHPRRIHLLVSSGVWCGDCARQGPMLRALAAACADVRLRLIDRASSPPLTEELRIAGAERVPIAVFLTEDFWELGRFGDRLLTAYRAKARRELGPACDSGLVIPPEEELRAECNEWRDLFERMLLMARLSPPLRARHGD